MKQEKDKTVDLIAVTSKLYEKALIRSMEQGLFGMPKPIGYRNVKVPVYLTIKIPVIKRDYDNDSEYGDGSFRGLLISLEERRLFRIGTKTVKEPIYPKKKMQGVVNFIRFSGLDPAKVMK